MRTTWWSLAILAACSGVGDGDGDGKSDTDICADGDCTPTDADTDADADSDTDVDTDTDTDVVETTAELDGAVTDLLGTGQAAVDLRLCRGPLCRNGTTDGGGAFLFEEVHVDWHSFEIAGPPGLATAFVPLEFGSMEARTVDVALPPIEATRALSGTREEHNVASALYITASIDDLEEPLFAPEPSEITGALVPEIAWLPTDGIPGTVIAMWYVGPFDYQAPGGLPVRVANQWAIADGATFRVWTGSYEESRWLDSGTLTANGYWLEGDALLPHLSTVVLAQE